MSQHELGRHLGISFQQIQKYEGGTNRISASVLFRLVQIFNVTPSYFYEGASEAVVGDIPVTAFRQDSDRLLDFARTIEGREVLSAYLKVEDPVIRKRVLELIRSMASTNSAEAPELAKVPSI
jgi:transcriptional regulator with XRE-family HTH domain